MLPAHADEWAVEDEGRVHRGRPGGRCMPRGGRLLPRVRPDRRRQRGVRLGHRPGAMARIWAGWLHHPGPVPEPDHRGVRADPGLGSADRRPLLHRGDLRRAAGLAAGGRRRGAARHPDAGVLLVAGLLRRRPGRTAAGRADPGPAGLLRCPHLPPGGQAGHLPHRVERGPDRVDSGAGEAQVLPPEPAEKADPTLA